MRDITGVCVRETKPDARLIIEPGGCSSDTGVHPLKAVPPGPEEVVCQQVPCVGMFTLHPNIGRTGIGW